MRVEERRTSGVEQVRKPWDSGQIGDSGRILGQTSRWEVTKPWMRAADGQDRRLYSGDLLEVKEGLSLMVDLDDEDGIKDDMQVCRL